MGIYEEITYKSKGDTLIETSNLPGVETVTVYQKVCVIENRTDCFCCSCGDWEGSDGACRNHGGYAKRPCDIHGFPGEPWQDTDDMPKSVLDKRKDNEKGVHPHSRFL